MTWVVRHLTLPMPLDPAACLAAGDATCPEDLLLALPCQRDVLNRQLGTPPQQDIESSWSRIGRPAASSVAYPLGEPHLMPLA
jgi:hypothetical protein